MSYGLPVLVRRLRDQSPNADGRLKAIVGTGCDIAMETMTHV